MEKILEMLSAEQFVGDETFDVTVLLATGDKVTGLIESTEGGVLSVRRLAGEQYADILRHYAISAVIGAYYTEGS